MKAGNLTAQSNCKQAPSPVATGTRTGPSHGRDKLSVCLSRFYIDIQWRRPPVGRVSRPALSSTRLTQQPRAAIEKIKRRHLHQMV